MAIRVHLLSCLQKQHLLVREGIFARLIYVALIFSDYLHSLIVCEGFLLPRPDRVDSTVNGRYVDMNGFGMESILQ